MALLRDRLLARLAEMGDAPDYARLAAEVLTIRNAPEDVARRLVAQALVMEDRRDHWRQVGESACAAAPHGPGVYVFLDAAGRVVYVGKALNLRRRLRAHFANRRWRQLPASMARVASVQWHEVGSELEALLIEAQWIAALDPAANVQRRVGPPHRSRTVADDLVLLLPAASTADAVIVAVRRGRDVWMGRAPRDGRDAAAIAARLQRFLATSDKHTPVTRAARRRGPATQATLPGVVEPEPEPDPALSHRDAPASPPDGAWPGLGPIVAGWLERRGAGTTRLDPAEYDSTDAWERALRRALGDDSLFHERLVFR